MVEIKLLLTEDFEKIFVVFAAVLFVSSAKGLSKLPVFC